LVDKPAGPTSHDAVAMLRRALRTRRVGHAGTLDPFATGLLLVLVGSATRLARYLAGLPKRYRGLIRLGWSTDTDDATGVPGAASDAWRLLSDDAIARAMEGLIGARRQVPPTYSAKHVGGERAHRRARRGEAVALEPVAVEIQRFTLVDRAEQDVAFETDVSSGTYVRSLARELGEQLGCGAHLVALRRLTTGPFTVEEAVHLDADGTTLGAALRPCRDAVRHLPAVPVDADGAARLRHGRPMALPGEPTAGWVALVSSETGALVAVGEVSGGEVHPRVVLEP